MRKRWAVANDPKLLERIALQEKGRVPSRAASLNAEPQKPMSQAVKRATKVALNNQESRFDTMHYNEATNSLTLVLARAMLLSLNVSLRMHDAKATKIKSTWLKRIEALKLTNRCTFEQWRARARYPVIVEEVYATAETSCLDVESVVAACKPIIDALVCLQFLPDDSPQYMAQPLGYTYRQVPSGLVLTLRPSPKPWGEISDATIQTARSLVTVPEGFV